MQSAQFELHAEIEQTHWWFVARRQIMKTLVAQVLPPGEGTIVDVGCGTGANIASLADDYDCVGIDTSGEGIELARRRFSNVRFINGRAPQDLGELAGGAQLFLLMDVLEHVPDDFAMLSELMAAAQPGAYFVLTVPADMKLWSPHDESFGHYRRYTRQRLAQVWSDLPVETQLLSHYNARLRPLVRLVRAANRRRGGSRGQAGTDFNIPSRPLNWALRRTFAGEAGVLVDALQGRRQRTYRKGVSLIALLRRLPGEIMPRSKPADIEADYFDPLQARSPSG